MYLFKRFSAGLHHSPAEYQNSARRKQPQRTVTIQRPWVCINYFRVSCFVR